MHMHTLYLLDNSFQAPSGLHVPIFEKDPQQYVPRMGMGDS